jgi:hypothetical protein
MSYLSVCQCRFRLIMRPVIRVDGWVSAGLDGRPACVTSQAVPAIPVIAAASEKQEKHKYNQNS